jgi:hypothetical protein
MPCSNECAINSHHRAFSPKGLHFKIRQRFISILDKLPIRLGRRNCVSKIDRLRNVLEFDGGPPNSTRS